MPSFIASIESSIYYNEYHLPICIMVSDKPVYERPIDENRTIKVICIGAGYSGILTAIRFPHQIHDLDLVIYEKNDDIGGE